MSLPFFWAEDASYHEESRPSASQPNRCEGWPPESGVTACSSLPHWPRALCANTATTTAAVGLAVLPVLPGRCGSCGRRDRRPWLWSTLEPSRPRTVSLATAASRAGGSRHTGASAAGCVLPRQPGATGVCCACEAWSSSASAQASVGTVVARTGPPWSAAGVGRPAPAPTRRSPASGGGRSVCAGRPRRARRGRRVAATTRARTA
jgi:hypothetical protein